jgi:hypothetical protein
MNSEIRRGLVLVVAAALVGVLVLGVGFDDPSPTVDARPTGTDPNEEPAPSATPVVNTIPRASVDVLVANATETSGFAGSISTQLAGFGYSALEPTNADLSQADGTSNIYYAAGFEASALDIAADLGLSSTQVAPLPAVAPVEADLTGVDIVVVLDADLVVAG